MEEMDREDEEFEFINLEDEFHDEILKEELEHTFGSPEKRKGRGKFKTGKTVEINNEEGGPFETPNLLTPNLFTPNLIGTPGDTDFHSPAIGRSPESGRFDDSPARLSDQVEDLNVT